MAGVAADQSDPFALQEDNVTLAGVPLPAVLWPMASVLGAPPTFGAGNDEHKPSEKQAKKNSRALPAYQDPNQVEESLEFARSAQ
jgi:hypothetical protein